MKPIRELSRSTRWEIGALVSVWFIAAWPFLSPWSSVYGFDTLAYTGPNLETAFSAWRDFRIPMWDSEIFGGVQFLGRLGSQGMYFMHLPFVFLSVNDALDLLVPMHLFLLAFGMCAFVRLGLKLRAPAGFVAGATAISCAYVSVKMLSYDQLVAIAWTPWILLFAELALQSRGGRRWVAPLALSVAGLFLGGHPQFIYMTFFVSIAYVAGRLADLRTFRAAVNVVAGGLLGVLASSLQIVSAWALGRTSGVSTHRSLESLSQTNYVLDTKRIFLGVIGDPFSSSPTSVSGSGEAILGVGLIAICLALLGLVLAQRRTLGLRLVLVLMGLGGVLLAVGPKWPVFRAAYHLVPGVGTARVPGRWLLLALIAVCVLAALGTDALQTSLIAKKRRALIAGMGTSFAGVLALLLAQNGRIETFAFLVCSWGAGGVVAVTKGGKTSRLLVLALLLGALSLEAVNSLRAAPPTVQQHGNAFDEVPAPQVRFARNQGGRVYAQTFDNFDDTDYLVRQLRPNTNKLYDLPSIDGYDGGQWIQKRWAATMRSVSVKPINTDLTLRSQPQFPLKAELFAHLGARWLFVDTTVVPASALQSGWVDTGRRAGPVEVWENPQWLGTGVLYFDTKTAKSPLFEELSTLPADTLLIESESLQFGCEKVSESECVRQAARPLSRGAEGGSFRTAASRRAILRIDESWSKDWKAHIDGKRAETLPVNGNSLGIEIPPGNHVVTFEFEPDWKLPFLLVSVVSLLLIGTLIINEALVQKRTGSRVKRSRSRRGRNS